MSDPFDAAGGDAVPLPLDADARVAALLARLSIEELDALAASMARLLVSAAGHRGPPRRRVPIASDLSSRRTPPRRSAARG